MFCTLPLYAQFGPQQVVSTTAQGCQQVYVADLNGDELPDIVSANKFISTVTWYENLGSGAFGPQQNVGKRLLNSFKSLNIEINTCL
ncbi:MAG: VCBS repeat-containing protein [Flavobacteriaceae bacterium]